MKSITLHGIDEPLVSLLESRAKAEGLSLNRVIKAILEEALGVRPKDVRNRRKEFEEFCGVWSKSDLAQFRAAIRDFEKVEDGDWK